MPIHNLFKFLAIASSLAIASCGGSDSAPAASTSLSGTAAAGAAIIGQVTVKGSMGNTKSALIEADGTYEVDVTGLTAPYRLRAEGTVGGRTYKLHSYAEEADVGGNVNITPFTDLIIANAAGQIAESYFDSSTPMNLDPVEIDAQEDALQAKLQDVFSALGVDAAIDLLNTTFSADHSGLDAALDVVSVEVDSNTNIATITNLIENTSVQDSVTDATDNTAVLTVTDPTGLTDAVSDTQQINNIFVELTAAFANGLPTAASLENYFTATFLEVDQTRDQLLTELTTDPNEIGLEFTNVSIDDLTDTTATATFYTADDGQIDGPGDPIIWQVIKDPTAGWQLHGDQTIVDYWFSYHCNDNDGTDNFTAGGCGINIGVNDNDFSNNGTLNDAPIASATASIIDGSDGTTVKGVVHLGTPSNLNGGTAGELQIYNAGVGYQGDYKGFGSTIADIEASTFAVGDILRFELYTEELDLSNTNAPVIELNATSVSSFDRPILFVPETSGRYPVATAATLSAMSAFELDDNLTVAWTPAAGTYNDEVLVRISDNQFNSLEIWAETTGSNTDSLTVSSTELSSSAANSAGLDPQATSYELRIRIYTQDEITGNTHSTDYAVQIGGPGVPTPTLACDYNSGWNDIADEPLVFNSYTDFEEVLTACGGANTLTTNDVIGTWTETWVEGNITFVETLVFNQDGTVNFTETENGVLVETLVVDWSLSNNLVTLSSSTLGFLDIWAITPQGQKIYTEESGWSVSPNLATLDDTDEGEIWTGGYVKQ